MFHAMTTSFPVPAVNDRTQFQVFCAGCRINHDIMIECGVALAEFEEEEAEYQAWCDRNPDYSRAEMRAESGHAQ